MAWWMTSEFTILGLLDLTKKTLNETKWKAQYNSVFEKISFLLSFTEERNEEKSYFTYRDAYDTWRSSKNVTVEMMQKQ